MDSDTETEFTEVTLSPTKEDSEEEEDIRPKLFFKRPNHNNNNNNFHSLPSHNSNGVQEAKPSLNFSSGWSEANNGMEEMTFNQGQMMAKLASMDLDSLAHNSQMLALHSPTIPEEEDSLNFDLQEVTEEDSLGHQGHQEEFCDSLQPKEDLALKAKNNKKLIIPYNESFSSTNSIFTTSQEGSLDSVTQGQTQAQTEEDSLTLNLTPIIPKPNWPVGQHVHQPKILGPEYQPGPYGLAHGPNVMSSGHAQYGPNVLAIGPSQHTANHSPVVPTSSPSLMKLATERMKKKFLGWS